MVKRMRAGAAILSIVSFSFILSLLLSGCSGALHTFTVPETGASITRMEGNRLSGGYRLVELNAQRFEKGGCKTYSLYVRHAGPSFINIEAGASLVLIIDGKRVELKGAGSEGHRTIISLGLVEEVAFYHDVDPLLFQSLAYAQQVNTEIHGSDSTLQRYFSEKNFALIKQFCDTQMNVSTSQWSAANGRE